MSAAQPPPSPRPPWHPERYGSAATLALLCALLLLGAQGRLGRGVAHLVDHARNDGPNLADSGRLTQDYYRGLLGDAGGAVSGLPQRLARWLLDASRDDPLQVDHFAGSAIARPGEGFLFRELAPGSSATLAGARVDVNEHGMRDDPCPLEPAPGRVRLAMVGASNDMGWGVAHEETWARRLEPLLAEAAGAPVDVLNFAVPGFTLLEQLWTLEHQAARFAPRLVLFTVTLPELRTELVSRLAARVRARRELGWEFVRDVVARAGVAPDDEASVAARKLRPFAETLVQGVLRELARLRERLDLPIAVVVLKLESGGAVARQLRWAADAAEREGLPVVRAFEACAPMTASEVYVDLRSDHHPSAAAHAALANEIAAALRADPRLAPLLEP